MSLNQVVLFREDFAGLPLGKASEYPSTAEGEYHVVDRTIGRWTVATIHHSWSQRASGNWRLMEEDGRRVMAHTMVALQSGPPMLITGDRYWGDYALEAEVRPLSFDGACGLIVRYQNCRCYLAARITKGQLCLIYRKHTSERLLASRGYRFDVDRYYKLRVECVGPKITVSLDGVKMLEVEEPEYLQGKVGFFAQAPTRFAGIAATTSRAANEAASARAAAWTAEEQALRAKMPQAKPWKKIATPGFGTDRNIRIGDLNGDGQPEILITQRFDLAGTDYCTLTCLTAIDLEGNILWRIGEPSTILPVAMSDNCVQVYDIDGDGCAEVIYCMDLRIHIADGRTGKTLRSAPTPRTHLSTAPGGRPYERVLGDSLYICNLDGGPRARNIILKDRYANVWALDDQLNVLWRYECTTGHFPNAYDIDGDGCDEVMAGYAMLDQDGTMLWELPYGDHQDATAIGHFDPSTPDELLVAQACGEEGLLIETAKGEMIAQHKIGHVQKLAVVKVRPDVPGLQYTAITFWGHPGIMAVYDCRGKLLSSFELVPYASALTPVNWDGSGQEYLFLSANPREGGLIDGFGRRVMMLPDDGHPDYCCASTDLDGDSLDELIVWDKQSIWIYHSDAKLPAGKRYRPIRPPRWNESNYMAQISLPNWA
ncbi:MAG: hypothetical protein GXY76_10630 [Chloroflexi bacterium]|nr:hypothetical protein [Chloroflexota bacterium]